MIAKTFDQRNVEFFRRMEREDVRVSRLPPEKASVAASIGCLRR